jgi:hypothetical protein
MTLISKTGDLAASPRRALSAKQYCFALLSAYIAIFFGIAAINLAVDPYGVFGTDILAPNNVNERFAKIYHLDAHHGEYDTYIFGSSTVGLTAPSIVEKYLPGNKVYNLYVTNGDISDYVAMLKYMLRRQFPVKTVIIQLDPDDFLRPASAVQDDGWQYVVFGVLHGGFLTVNHLFHYLKKRLSISWEVPAALGMAITYICANIGFVFFRSQDLKTAMNVLAGMAGANGFILPKIWEDKLGPISSFLKILGVSFGSAGSFDRTGTEIVWIAALQIIVFVLPNTQQITGLPIGQKGTPGWRTWEPSYKWLAFTCVAVALSVPFLTRVTEFIYFQF